MKEISIQQVGVITFVLLLLVCSYCLGNITASKRNNLVSQNIQPTVTVTLLPSNAPSNVPSKIDSSLSTSALHPFTVPEYKTSSYTFTSVPVTIRIPDSWTKSQEKNGTLTLKKKEFVCSLSASSSANDIGGGLIPFQSMREDFISDILANDFMVGNTRIWRIGSPSIGQYTAEWNEVNVYPVTMYSNDEPQLASMRTPIELVNGEYYFAASCSMPEKYQTQKARQDSVYLQNMLEMDNLVRGLSYQ